MRTSTSNLDGLCLCIYGNWALPERGKHYVESWSARTSGSGKRECPGCPTLAEMQVNAHKNLELETLKIWVQQGRDEERDFQ